MFEYCIFIGLSIYQKTFVAETMFIIRELTFIFSYTNTRIILEPKLNNGTKQIEK